MPGKPVATPGEKFPVVDTSMQTNIAEGVVESPAPGRADTVQGEDPHMMLTVADEEGPSAELLAGLAASTPAPDSKEAAAFDAEKAAHQEAEDTDTETVSRPPGMPNKAGSTSPFAEEASEQAAVASSPPPARALSPDVLTRTIAEEHVIQQEAAAPSPDSLPPLPSPRTPKPMPPASVLAAGAPPVPTSASKGPPRPASPSSAPPIPARASQSGVVSSAAIEGASSGASAASAGSRSGVVSSAPPIPGLAKPPENVAGGRPSEVLPRPPASAVVRPAPPAAGQHPPAQAMMAGSMPVASPAPPSGPVASPAPQMMQSFPTPSNMARPPAPGMVQGAPPGMVDPSMVAMPAAYALPGTGYPPGAAPPQTGQAPLVHTPIPPGLIGPPPDLNEGPGLGAALDSLGQESHNPRENTPAANAVWRSAHPSAQKWAAKRHGGSHRTPKPGIIALGLMLAGLGAYLLAIFLPSKQPLTAAMIEELSKQAGVDEKAWRFSEQLIDVAYINAGLFVLLGVIVLLKGALYKQQSAGHGRKGMSKPAILLVFCFVLLSVTFGALVMSAST